MRRAILDALRAKYEAEIAEADATVNIYLTNSVGIGEHTNLLDEVKNWTKELAEAEEGLATLEENF